MPRMFSGRLLRERRDAAGLTRRQLALRIARSQYTIIDYERGKAVPSVAVLSAIADALNVPVGDFFDDPVVVVGDAA